MSNRGLKLKSTQEQLVKKNYNDAGLDIRSNEAVVIPAGESQLVKTDLYIAVPVGTVGLIKSRSGLAVKKNIEVGAGVIDSDYRGEVGVLLRNLGKEEFVVQPGDRIAQLLTIPVLLNKYAEVESLPETNRGEGGFGSSGVK